MSPDLRFCLFIVYVKKRCENFRCGLPTFGCVFVDTRMEIIISTVGVENYDINMQGGKTCHLIYVFVCLLSLLRNDAKTLGVDSLPLDVFLLTPKWRL